MIALLFVSLICVYSTLAFRFGSVAASSVNVNVNGDSKLRMVRITIYIQIEVLLFISNYLLSFLCLKFNFYIPIYFNCNSVYIILGC